MFPNRILNLEKHIFDIYRLSKNIYRGEYNQTYFLSVTISYYFIFYDKTLVKIR